MKTILRYIKPKRGPIAFGICVKFLGTIAELLLPWMLSVMLDDLVPLGNMGQIWLWGGLMFLGAALALVFNVVANRMANATSRDITQSLRHDLFARILTLSSAQEDHYTTPSLISRLTNDSYNVHQMIDRMQRLGVRAPILLFGGISITIAMEPVLTLVLLATLPLLAFLVYWVSKRGIGLYKETQNAQDNLLRRAQESMTGIRVIQALSKSTYEATRFDEANRALVAKERKTELFMNITSPVMTLVLNIGLTLVIVVGAFRVNEGETQPGTIIAFLSYFAIILNALMMISRLFVMYTKGIASGLRIAEILDAPLEMQPQALPVKKDMGHIHFCNVSFSYEKKRSNLTNITFSLQKGQTLGIIGATGSGKSTLVRLLLRFYDPDKGEIYLSGHNLRSIDPAVLYPKFGVVFQNDFLYAGAIYENIDFGRHLTTAQIHEAADTAQGDFIRHRMDGFASHLASKGANISGGQRQRLLIARALAANPEILVLDDCSSALDYKTDAHLRQALATQFAETTKIIVAQRISSIRSANLILMLNDGQAVGCGSHEELLLTCPSYREIAEIQMGGAREWQ